MLARVAPTVLVTLLAVGCRGSSAGGPGAQPPEGQVCTRDAKVCPDGATVGRTGPNCEFAACPAAAPAPAGQE